MSGQLPFMLTPAEAIAAPELLGLAFTGDSWDTWRAILKAAYAEPLTPRERTLFAEVAGNRAPPQHRVKELWVIAGRRSGKDSIASAIAATTALTDYRKFLRPGERASVLCLAVDRAQAAIVHRYIVGYFRDVPLLQRLAMRESNDGLELNNNCEVVIATNSFRSVRGRTVAAIIFDEVSFWRDETCANPDVETYNAVMPGLVTLPGAMLIGITTAYRKAGLAYSKFAEAYAKNDPDVLVVYGPARTFNPLLPQSVIDAALARDPEAARAEWLSEWRSDLSDFIDRELVEQAIDKDVHARPPHLGIRYVAFADPSGGRGDAFTTAIAHRQGDAAILDCLIERRPPFDPDDVVEEIARVLRSYRIHSITGDRYAAEWVVSAFRREGISYHNSDRDRSELYLDALPLFTAGRARLLDNARLVYQFTSLERRTSRMGRDRIDHGAGGHDDLANSAAGALVLAAHRPASLILSPQALQRCITRLPPRNRFAPSNTTRNRFARVM
jgi:hypothetical protein